MSGEQAPRDPSDSEGRRRFARRIKTANTIVELLSVRRQGGELDAEWYDPASDHQLKLKRGIDPRIQEQAHYRYLFRYSSAAESGTGESVILFDEKSVDMHPLSGPIAHQCKQLDFHEAQGKMRDTVDGFFQTAPIPTIDSLPEATNDEES